MLCLPHHSRDALTRYFRDDYRPSRRGLSLPSSVSCTERLILSAGRSSETSEDKWLYDITFGYGILRDASKAIAETEVGINEYRKLGVNPDKIVLIHPPLDTDEFSRLPPPGLFRRRYDIKEKHVVLFLGRIHWIKGIDFLVESFYQLVQQRHDALRQQVVALAHVGIVAQDARAEKAPVIGIIVLNGVKNDWQARVLPSPARRCSAPPSLGLPIAANDLRRSGRTTSRTSS